MKYLRSLCTLLYGVAVVLFFGIAYPHHLHYQEQFQLFLFDGNYVWDILKLPGGVADLLGRFCTQFFLYAWVGALIIGVLLSVVQLLTLRLFDGLLCRRTLVAERTQDWAFGLSFVPSFLLWLFLLDENALLGGVWAVLLTLAASWIFDLIPGGWTRRILLILAIPLLYFLVGPISVVFFLLQAPHPRRSPWYYGVFLLLAIMIVALSYQLPVAADRLWTGIHYHRYPTIVPKLWWAAALSVFVLTFIVRVCQKWADASSKSFLVPLCSFAVVAIVMGSLVGRNANIKAEKVMQYDFMACHQQWNRILQTAGAEKPNNQIGVTIQNLALAMRGKLVDHLYDYRQNGILGLLPDVAIDATSPLPTAEAYYQLGMISMAQRTVFEAQEAILDFQKSGRCYKRLAQTNLINGSYEVARKYLMALQKTIFYREWANETLQLLGNEEAIAKHPEYGRLRPLAFNDDFYFGDRVTSEMLESLYVSNKDNLLAYQYLLAYYMLTGDRDNYTRFLRQTSVRK